MLLLFSSCVHIKRTVATNLLYTAGGAQQVRRLAVGEVKERRELRKRQWST